MYTVMYMAAMIRKQIYIEPRQDKDLKTLARKLGETEAEFIRHAVDERVKSLRDQEERASAWARIERIFEERNSLNVPQQKRTWRREDLYEERTRFPRH